MKKTLLLFAVSLLTLVALTSCNDNANTPADPDETTAQTQQETVTETIGQTTDLGINFNDYAFVQIFEAPKGNDYRQIAYDYMLSMANYTWVAGEDFSITWEDEGDFKINLEFKKRNEILRSSLFRAESES